MSAFIIDAFEFCRLREQCEGDVPVADMPRLAAESVNAASASLHWVLQGGEDGFGHAQLTMTVTGKVHLMCQRCMTPLEYAIESEQVLILAKSDEHADEIDALLADDTIDVIVGSRSMNVRELVEDEALLSLPLAPKHETCPDNVATDALTGARKPSPFDVLKGMKQ